MDTELLRTFLTVARTGSFTAAARELGYVQSTATGHLQTLERRLDVRLLDRLPSGALPTDAGTRLLTYAAQMLDMEDRLLADVPNPSGHVAGHVRLVAPESLCAYRLPPLLRNVRQMAPHVRLTLAPASTAQALRAVRDGTAEVALLLEPRITAADVRLVPLGTEDLTALAPPDLALPAPTVTWAHLADYDVLLLEDGCSYSDDVERRLLAVGQPDSRRIRFGSIETVKRCVAAGLGWTVLPTVTAAAELRAGTLTAVDVPLPTRPTVYRATQPHRTLSSALHLVLDQLTTPWAAVPQR